MEIFDAFDDDKSGTIDKNEFDNIMRWYTKESFTEILDALHSEPEFAHRVTFSTRFTEFMRQQKSYKDTGVGGDGNLGSKEAALLATTLEQKSGTALARMALKFDSLADKIRELP